MNTPKFKPVSYDVNDLAPRQEHTLLAKLGFKDADLGSHLHDLACNYVIHRRIDLINSLGPNVYTLDQVTAKSEVVLSAWNKFTVGFLDVLITVSPDTGPTKFFIVEVKTAPVQLGVLVRQLKLYEEHYHAGLGHVFLLAALTYTLNTREVQALEREGIRVVLLGEKFKTWCAESVAPANMPEL